MNNSETKTNHPEQFAQARINAKKSFSPVWILPIVALLIGLGLLVKSYLSAGVMITLQVRTAEGIEIGKTKVLYKGIITGIVKDKVVTEDLQNVILHIEMDKRTEDFLNENAKFWIVEPRISLSGISGLDTLLSGRYIAINTKETGKSKRDFMALEIPPPPSTSSPGLHIKLRLNHLSSIDRGTQIYYKQIPVGEVINYTLEENDTEIHAWVLIEPKYAHLVKENSHFYNVSGIKIDAGLSGIEIETESLVSVIAGGIAFYNPIRKEKSKPAKNGNFYLLYSDFETAQVGIPIILRIKNADSLQENVTQIKFQGHSVGRIGKFTYDKKTNEMIVLANIDPLLEEALKENTQFWVVKPSVSLLSISGLDALLSGNYIQMRPTLKGKFKREFTVSESVPALSANVPGLHFFIKTSVLGSLTKGSPIYYKNIPVGHIEGYQLTIDSEAVQLKAFIKPEFAHLVKKSTHFYNVSGLSVTGGVSGLKVKMESITALIKGGIAFFTPDFKKASDPGENGDTFQLFSDFENAQAGIEISLSFNDATGLTEGITKIIYKGMLLGTIKKVKPIKGKKKVLATAMLNPLVEDALLEDTKFWMVRPKISITEVKNLDTLINGDYITLRIGSSTKKRTSFKVTQTRPPFDKSYPGLHLKLSTSSLGSISVGAPVMFNQIKIGDVQDYELAKDRTNINILIHIWPQYMDMVTSKSRFYNTSGIHIDASLAGVEIQTGSVESILKGGIALYKPSGQSKSKSGKVRSGHHFKLFKDYDAAHANAFYIRVQFAEPKGLVVGSQLHYRGVNVGSVEKITLNEKNSNSIWVTLEVNSLLKPLLGKKSRFWVSTAKLGLARTENLDTLVKGSYIRVQPVKGNSTDFFIGQEEKPLIQQSNTGFNISLTASRLSSIKTGDPVYYRQVKVGSVVGYELADTADQILVHLSIRNRFKPLIRENSKFWHASGIDMELSLFGASKIRTESLEAILAGGIAFATPDNINMGKILPPGSFFVLHDAPKSEWTKWNPIIHLVKEIQQD